MDPVHLWGACDAGGDTEDDGGGGESSDDDYNEDDYDEDDDFDEDHDKSGRRVNAYNLLDDSAQKGADAIPSEYGQPMSFGAAYNYGSFHTIGYNQVFSSASIEESIEETERKRINRGLATGTTMLVLGGLLYILGLVGDVPLSDNSLAHLFAWPGLMIYIFFMFLAVAFIANSESRCDDKTTKTLLYPAETASTKYANHCPNPKCPFELMAAGVPVTGNCPAPNCPHRNHHNQPANGLSPNNSDWNWRGIQAILLSAALILAVAVVAVGLLITH